MEPSQMLEELIEKGENLKKELLELEQEFNMKKEQFIKIQGAIEALNAISEPLQQ
jgi:hypothetical protein